MLDGLFDEALLEQLVACQPPLDDAQHWKTLGSGKRRWIYYTLTNERYNW